MPRQTSLCKVLLWILVAFIVTESLRGLLPITMKYICVPALFSHSDLRCRCGAGEKPSQPREPSAIVSGPLQIKIQWLPPEQWNTRPGGYAS